MKDCVADGTPLVVVGSGKIACAIAKRTASWGTFMTPQLSTAGGDLTAALMSLRPSCIVLAAGSPKHAAFVLDHKALYEHITVTRTVAETAARLGAFLIFISSWLVYEGCSARVDEQTAPQPETPYAVMKRLAEQIVLQTSSAVLRCGTVVGDELAVRNPSVLHRLVAASQGQQTPCLKNDNVAFVHRDDLASLVHLVARETGRGPIYNVASWTGSLLGLVVYMSGKRDLIAQGESRRPRMTASLVRTAFPRWAPRSMQTIIDTMRGGVVDAKQAVP